jgi:hypothetical protein
MQKVVSLFVVSIVLLLAGQVVAQAPTIANLDQPTCEDRLMASKKGLINVALQVTELEAQTEHLRKLLASVTR